MESRLQLKLLAPEEITTIYEKCQDVLSKKGMKIDHPHALKMLEKEGAWIDYKSRQVRFPKDIIRDALDEIDFCAFPSPTDAPKQTADIHALKIFLENTTKHINVQP